MHKCCKFFQLEFNFPSSKSANRAVEVNEMWRVRQKELELDDRIKGRLKDESNNGKNHMESNPSRSISKRHVATNDSSNASCSSSKGAYSCDSREDDGLRDEELEKFLHSRSALIAFVFAPVMCMALGLNKIYNSRKNEINLT